MEQYQESRRGPRRILVDGLDLELYSGKALGDLKITCCGCGKGFSPVDKLALICREAKVLYSQGRFTAFCDSCSSAVVV